MKEWEWQLVNDHIDNFDNNRLAMFSPPERLGMDESFIIWLGLGGDWFNLCLPHYVQMYCKPDAGCKIQDACCKRSMAMMKLKLVKDKSVDGAAESANGIAPAYDENHGAIVLK